MNERACCPIETTSLHRWFNQFVALKMKVQVSVSFSHCCP